METYASDGRFPTKQALWQAVVDEVIVPGIEAAIGQLSDDAGGAVEAVIATRLRQALTTQGLSGSILLDNTDGAHERLTYLADATQRTFLDIDITDDEQREALVADITDIYLYGIIPRT